MRDHMLANLILDDECFLAEHPGVLLRAKQDEACFEPAREGLVIKGDVDFTTYLNALSVGKWQQYTGCNVFCLRLELRGAGCKLFSTALFPESFEVVRSERPLLTIEASEDWQAVDVVLPVPQGAHIISFALASQGETVLRSGCWYAKVNDADVRDVRLAIATTTFRKEAYVTRNIEAIRADIFESDYEHADDIKLIVVDNGRTLDAEALSDDHVSVIPNPNVGGSGGFARGMMEALDRE